MILSNQGNILPDISLTMKLDDKTNILNIKWTYAQLPEGYTAPYEIPLDIVGGTITPGATPLSDFVDLT